MPYKTCQHVMEHGQLCQSPALKKKDYCYFHAEFRARRLKMARARARGERWWLDLPCIEDLRSCQAASARVFEASAAGLIDQDHAKLLCSMLRMMASNFKARKAWGPLSDYRVNEGMSFVGEYPGFETVHDLPKDIDLDEDPLKLFPMPQEASEPGAPFKPSVGLSGNEDSHPLANGEERMANSGFSSGAPLNPSFGLSGREESHPLANSEERMANSGFSVGSMIADILKLAESPADLQGLHVTADDIERWEIEEREGEHASQVRGAELERNRRRRERRLERARYEEIARTRNIQLAAQKLLRDQQRAQAAAAETAANQTAAAHAAAAQMLKQQAEAKTQTQPRRNAPNAAMDAAAKGKNAAAKKPPLSAPNLQPEAQAKAAAGSPME